MPYIHPAARFHLDEGGLPKSPGELNYAVTKLLLAYYEARGESYTTYNDMVGVLECAKIEMYRRYIAAYEDEKRAQNGDVY